MKMSDAELMVLVDLETTGLDEKDGLPLEAGILIVDLDLNVIAAEQHIIQWGKLDWDKSVSEFVRNMHDASGLRKEYDAGAGHDVAAVEGKLIQFLIKHGATSLPMAGSNVANFDRLWLREYLPDLNDHFHYRNQDVSSLKEFCRVWNPEVYAKLPPKEEAHRPIADCMATLDEFKFYRDNFLFTTR